MNSDLPQAKAGLDKLPRYVAGVHTIDGNAEPMVLSANENPRGASPNALTAIQLAASNIHRYPEGNPQQLKEDIAEAYRISSDMGQIILGAGSDEIISLLTAGFGQTGSEVLISEHGFLMYPIAAKSVGAIPRFIAEQNYHADIDALLAAADANTSMVFLANPNNPTGTYLPDTEIRRLVAGLPKHVLLVLDCAYSEYVERNDYSSNHDLVATGRVAVLHTFSKVYGLAGARVGWGLVSPEVADIYERLRSPFNISAPALAAASAAVKDTDYLTETVALNRIERAKLLQGLAELSISVLPSETNFLLLDFASKYAAQAADKALKKHGIIARGMTGYGLPSCIRISIGLPHENAAVLRALRES